MVVVVDLMLKDAKNDVLHEEKNVITAVSKIILAKRVGRRVQNKFRRWNQKKIVKKNVRRP